MPKPNNNQPTIQNALQNNTIQTTSKTCCKEYSSNPYSRKYNENKLGQNLKKLFN